MRYRALLILALSATVNRPTASAATKELTSIKTTKLIDVRTGKLLIDQTILVDRNKIVRVASSSDLDQPATEDVRVIDLAGLTVLPGLIDCHAHIL